MNASTSTPAGGRSGGKSFLWAGLALLIVIGLLFGKAFVPGQIHFANDGPLGLNASESFKLPEGFTGVWLDLYWLGSYAGCVPPDILFGMMYLLGPVGFMKFNAPLSLIILGLCACFCFWRLKFRWWICVLGAIAAALNMNYFSNSCWGTPGRALTLGMVFLAIGCLQTTRGWRGVVMAILAGFAVGVGIMEGSDYGAIFSLYVAAYTVFLMMNREGSPVKNFVIGSGRTAIVAGFAGLMAAQALFSLIETQFGRGSLSGQQDQRSTEERWDWATQWSLPKKETLRVIIPGLYGYRMDSPEGGEYWGRVGQQPGWQTHRQGFPRYSGSGEYAGVLVVLLAIFALAESLRSTNSIYSLRDRRFIWFWAAAAFISLVLAFGRHAPFYQIIFKLPYFSSIRNPIKFMHSFHMAVLILFGYGLDAIARRYLDGAAGKAGSILDQVKLWWSKAGPFEKKWTYASFGAVAASVVGWLIYAGSRNDLVRKLTESAIDPSNAAAVAKFSINEVALYGLFLMISVGLIALIMSGVFNGARWKWAAFFLGLVLTVDLARANKPWIRFFDYREKYASNAVIDAVREKAHEHRIAVWPTQVARELSILQQVYQVEWLQHQMPFYNVQSLDITQDPRVAAEKVAYRQALATNAARLFQLTNTRYILGLAGGFAEALNSQIDPGKRRFRERLTFGLAQGQGDNNILVQTNGAGPYSLLEFTGALPRVKLYQTWNVITNESGILAELASPNFDPENTVLVMNPIAPASGGTNAATASAEITSYKPRRVQINTKSASPTLLLINSKFDPHWHATVDGKRAEVLRCNYLMQGVQLPAGEHKVEMHFQPPLTGLYITLVAIALAVLLCGVLFVARGRDEEELPATTPAAVVAPEPSRAPKRK